MNFQHIVIFKIVMLIVLSLSGCASRKKRYNLNTIQKNNDGYLYYTPFYKDNGGKKNTTIFNKKDVERERQFMSVIKIFNDLQKDFSKNKKDFKKGEGLTDSINQNIINDVLYELDKLTQELLNYNNKNTYNDQKQFENFMNLAIKLNELKCKKIEVINDLLKIDIKKIQGDISFRFNSSDITNIGKNQLDKMLNDILSEIDKWKNYINSCNQKIFDNETFILIMDIDGYADEVGLENYNLELSKKRAESVEIYFKQKLLEISKQNLSINFSKIKTKGHGEELPPNVTRKGPNDPERRICIIKSMIAPKVLLQNIKL